MANTYLKGVLGFKGERGYSAYEIAVKNGFVGSEKQWLATLGTATNNLTDNESVYTTQTDGETEFVLPDEYTSNSVIEVFLDGVRLTNTMYTINTSARKVILNNPVVKGTAVEIKVLTLVASETPISDEINASSTNDTTAGSKAVYDLVNPISEDLNDLSTVVGNLSLAIDSRLETESIQAITGSIASIGAGETKTTDINYPAGFTKGNTHIIGKMTSNNNVYYDSIDLTPTTNGFPVIKMVALLDSVIRVWMTNTNSSEAKIGYYKITLLKK